MGLEDKTGKEVSNYDQMLAAVADLSKIVGDYYNGLVENGTPEDLAAEMAKDLSRVFWIKAMTGQVL